MHSSKDKQTKNDFARVEISTPFNNAWLKDFLKDPQRILRINSQLEFSTFEKMNNDSWHMTGKNLSNKQDFDIHFKTKETPSGIRLDYTDDSSGLKNSTEITIKHADNNTHTLVITDDYSGTSEEQRKQRIAEVDSSIVQWANDLHRYFRQWKRWSWLPGWKPYMLKFWQKMKPSARRISFMLFAITLAEFVIFLFVFLIFWLELGK